MILKFKPAPASATLMATLVIAWFLSGRYLGLDWFASQKSSQLLLVGAVDGAALGRSEYWRLLVSQFLHVHCLHMLFNAFAIFVLASAMERGVGRAALLSTYFLGGTIGQYFSVYFHPDLVSSGASQALMALCGFLAVTARRCGYPPYALLFAVLISAIQIGLDVAVSASLKSGHGFGFVAGALIGVFTLIVRYTRIRNST